MVSFGLKSFFKDTVALCFRDSGNQVLYQNQMSRNLCGDKKHTQCSKEGCLEYYKINPKFPERAEGIQFFSSAQIKNKLFDLIIVNSKKYFATILYPLMDKFEKETLYFKNAGLGKRELEIALLALQGYSNSQIEKKLCISKPTLKTHLGNIYKKIPDLKGSGFRGFFKSNTE